MRHLPSLALCGLLSLAACAANTTGAPGGASTAQGQAEPTAEPTAEAKRAAALLEQSTRTLRDMRRDTPNKALEGALAEARAVIVLPGVYQAGFFYSVRGGTGVLVARRPDGGWGAPVFVGVAGVGYGIQAGLEKSRLVLVITEEEMLERILANGLNLETAAEYDIIGVREEMSQGTLTTRRPVMAFGDGAGLMAGVAVRGGLLTVNSGLTRSYHGAAAGSVEEIMRGASAPGMEVFAFWAALGVEPRGPEIVRMRQP